MAERIPLVLVAGVHKQIDPADTIPVSNLPVATPSVAGAIPAASEAKVEAAALARFQALGANAFTDTALTTPTIDGELSSATKQQRLTAMAAEYGAGARGLQLIETWATPSAAATHTLSLVPTQWRELVILFKGLGDGTHSTVLILESDGSSTGCSSHDYYASADYTGNAVLIYMGGIDAELEVHMIRMPSGGWSFRALATSAGSGLTRLHEGRVAAAATSFTIRNASGYLIYQPSQTAMKVYGVADEVSASAPVALSGFVLPDVANDFDPTVAPGLAGRKGALVGTMDHVTGAWQHGTPVTDAVTPDTNWVAIS